MWGYGPDRADSGQGQVAMYLQEVGCGSMERIELAKDWDRLRWIFRKWDVGVWIG